MTKTLCTAVQYLRDILRSEGMKHEVPHRDAEKESAMAIPVQPSYKQESTPFSSIVENPKLIARETEWLSMTNKRTREANISPINNASVVDSSLAQDDATAPDSITGSLEGRRADSASQRCCAFCKAICEVTRICKKCRGAAYCSLECNRSDWYRHKFSCTLGRPIDATDYLVLACHANKFPYDDDVANSYGFMHFSSGHDRWRLFKLYRRLIVNWKIDEDEMRSAVEQNRLKDMLMFRCSQTRDFSMLRDMQWLKNAEGFGSQGEGRGLAAIFKSTQEELLSDDEKSLSLLEIQPPEKRQALVFFAQIRNAYKPDVNEDNWISLGFCTAADPEAEQQLAAAYGSLVERCQFDEFWNAMVQSRMVKLFTKYGLADRILRLRNFEDFMGIVKRWHQSVWNLKRFTRTDEADPFRAVVVDYGFMNCNDAGERMQLRAIYREYFEQGKDEMRLHDACVAGRLSSFLDSVLGSLAVRRDLLQNPYPLENGSLMGMVTDSVVMCSESDSKHINAFVKNAGKEIMVIPDTEGETIDTWIHDRAAFPRTALRKRLYSGPDGKVITELTV